MGKLATAQGASQHKIRYHKKAEAPKLSETPSSFSDVVASTTGKLEEAMFITEVFVPGKEHIGHDYRSDFTLKSKKEAKKINPEIYNKNKTTPFFVYNECTKQLLPFKKNDFLLYEYGHCVFDGKMCITYDNDGIEIGRF